MYKSGLDEDSDSDSENEEVVTGLRTNRSDVVEDWEESSDSDDEETRSMSPLPEDTNCEYIHYNQIITVLNIIKLHNFVSVTLFSFRSLISKCSESIK